MTEEEADALDELWTRTTPEIDMSKPGYYSTRMAHFVEVDDFTAGWLCARAEATHQSRKPRHNLPPKRRSSPMSA